ncbi:MAG: Holliday junction resolvase-like protein [archaeon]
MELTIIIIITLFLAGLIIFYLIGYKIGSFRKNREWELELPNHRRDAISKSRAVLSGQFSEQMAPYFPDFNFKPTECRFIGKPVDFIVFRGMDEKKIEEVVFVEVKSGKAKLSSQEKNLKDTINKKRVRWEEYKVPDKDN